MKIETSSHWKGMEGKKVEERKKNPNLVLCNVDFLLVSDESTASKHLISELIQLTALYAVVYPQN